MTEFLAGMGTGWAICMKVYGTESGCLIGVDQMACPGLFHPRCRIYPDHLCGQQEPKDNLELHGDHVEANNN